MRSFFFSVLLLLIYFSPVQAFDDDSRDDTRPEILNTLCENNQIINDTPTLKSSCRGDIVNLQNRNTTLVKNGKTITQSPVLDFKVSRNGKVFYRTRTGPYLFDESGKLRSLGRAVIIYLVSANDDIVYLNNQGIVFKNGKSLNQNKGRVSFHEQEISTPLQKLFFAPKLAVTTNGQAVYINDKGLLFVDRIAMSPRTARVIKFRVDSQATVYYLDDLGRLYIDRAKVFQKAVRVKDFKINIQSQIAYLTAGTSKNLYFEGHNLSAGSHRILSFSFTGAGEVIYKDDIGRVWKMGQLISD